MSLSIDNERCSKAGCHNTIRRDGSGQEMHDSAKQHNSDLCPHKHVVEANVLIFYLLCRIMQFIAHVHESAP